ncbi:MAG TPA: SPFH domain-containing protein [Thermoanaerobaculia bacterium]|nr:SPFH domain-containing protein [Thermoanaerobaculia bacterium]
MLVLVVVASLILFITFIAFAKRYKRCPSDRILVVYGKISGSGRGGMSAACYHGGAAFIWPLLQDYAFLDLTPLAIDIKLEGALSLQNIRVNTPSTFTVGISTEPGVMENAAERLLGMEMKQVAELARDIIFGQMRVVMATMPIEAINADRDKLIENISQGVEVELKKVGLRLINVNIQDITDASGYIDALGKEAAARAINEARVKVAEQEREGAIGAANAERDRRIQVAQAHATAVEGENLSAILVAQSSASRREQEAEAERQAAAAEKVKSAQALAEAYQAEELAERQRAKREQAAQEASIVVPAEIEKRRIETLAEAEAERTRRLKKGEADGLQAMMEAEATGVAAILSRKAEGFERMVAAAQGLPELAALLLVTEQLPKLVEEQVKAISNVKIDKVTVWEGGRGHDGNGGSGKTATADFLSGLVGSLPPLHELTRNVGVKLPEYLGTMEREEGGGGTPPVPPAKSGGSSTAGSGRQLGAREDEAGGAGRQADGAPRSGRDGNGAEARARAAKDAGAAASPPDSPPAGSKPAPARPAEANQGAAPSRPMPGREALAKVRARLAARPEIFGQIDANQDGRLTRDELEAAVTTVFDWARRAAADRAVDWYYTAEGKAAGPTSWERLRRLAADDPDLLVNRDRAPFWLPYGAVADAAETETGGAAPS